jgi:hypothetical protein
MALQELACFTEDHCVGCGGGLDIKEVNSWAVCQRIFASSIDKI